jgi:hypothetical protein
LKTEVKEVKTELKEVTTALKEVTTALKGKDIRSLKTKLLEGVFESIGWFGKQIALFRMLIIFVGVLNGP